MKASKLSNHKVNEIVLLEGLTTSGKTVYNPVKITKQDGDHTFVFLFNDKFRMKVPSSTECYVVGLEIDLGDLKALFVHTRNAYGNRTFGEWCDLTKVAYCKFIKGKDNPKTFSQWVNGQIIALT